MADRHSEVDGGLFGVVCGVSCRFLEIGSQETQLGNKSRRRSGRERGQEEQRPERPFSENVFEKSNDSEHQNVLLGAEIHGFGAYVLQNHGFCGETIWEHPGTDLVRPPG